MSIRAILLLFLTVILLAILLWVLVIQFNKWLRYKERLMAFQLRQDNNKAMSGLRITAYERITVMLERIAPEALVMRLSPGARSASQLQMELMRAVREEFEHNISLQIYVSQRCWKDVEKARDQVSELIKVAYTKVAPNAPAMELSRTILFLENEVGSSGLHDALNAVRQEMSEYF